jgi:hypothetical protein
VRRSEASIPITPYIRLNGKLVIKSSYERDILPEHIGLEVIPQIITNDPDECSAKYVQELGQRAKLESRLSISYGY